MKKIHYIYGIISEVIVMLGVIFKVQHWPGASIMLTVGIASLLFLFLPIALINSYKHEGNSKNRILYIVSYLTALVVLAGALFKIMHWPFANILIVIALPFPFVVFLPVYIYVTSKIENFDLNKTVLVLLTLVYVSVFSALLALNISKNMLDSTLSMGTSLKNMQAGLQQYASLSGDQKSNLSISANELLSIVELCHEKIYQETGTTEIDLKQGLFGVRAKDSQGIGQSALQYPENDPPMQKLRSAMDKFKEEVSVNNPGLRELSNKLLNTSDYNEEGSHIAWEAITFNNHHLSWILSYLEGIKSSVYLLETQASNK